MTTATYHNSPVRNCKNCAHYYASRIEGDDGAIAHSCLRTHRRCVDTKDHGRFCDYDLRGWQPIPTKPSRRSLRRWLWETFRR